MALTPSPKSSLASNSKTELKPQKIAGSRHHPQSSNTRFDNNSKIKRDDIKLFMVAAFGCLFANELIEA